MTDFSKSDAVRILVNLDTLSCGHIPSPRLAWAHIFVALGLIQRSLPNPVKLTRERWLELAGKVYDKVYSSLEDPTGPSA